MANFLVAYDAEHADRMPHRHALLVSSIQALGAWAQIHAGVWAVDTDLALDLVFDALEERVDPEHRLFVAKVCGGSAPRWSNPLCSTAWLERRW